MPDFKVKDQSFKLWKNKYKKDGDKKPDYTGNGMFNGSTKDVALWINKDKNGNRYLSGQLNEPKAKDESPF
tara:strand:- start:4238 stop:4450 length:213 start_codon:yes stop_codon:yes gene_type:complete